MDKRDAIMAENIIEILERYDVDNLVCIIGKAHVKGVEENIINGPYNIYVEE